MIIEFIKKLFSKKEEKETYPSDFGLIRVNDIAKGKGVNDDHVKKIFIYKNNKLEEVLPYNESIVTALREVDGIPVEEEQYDEEEGFEWDSASTLGVFTYKK